MKKETKILISIFLLCLSLKIILLFITNLEPFHSPDGDKYIGWAKEINDTGSIYRKQFIFPLFIFIVYSIFGEGNNTALIMIQSILTSFLPIIIYYTIKTISDKRTALMGACITLGFPEFYYWNNFILSEAIYILLITLSIYSLVRFYKIPNIINFIFVIISIIVTFKTREASIVMIVFIIFTILYTLHIKLNWIYLKNKKLITIFPIMFLLLGGLLSINDYIPNQVSKKVNVLNKFSYGWDESYHLGEGRNLIKHDTLFSSTKNKFYYFWVICLDRFQPIQKVVNVFTLIPLYLFSIVCLLNFKKRKEKIIITMIALCILSTAGLHAITFLDYNYRYRLPIIPLLIILASIGLNDFYVNYIKSKDKK